VKRLKVTLRDPDGILVEERTFLEWERDALAEFVSGFVFYQGIDPGEAQGGLSGSVEFEPVRETGE
jgi:uncharacterized membrane protein YidH (DUF202 family)